MKESPSVEAALGLLEEVLMAESFEEGEVDRVVVVEDVAGVICIVGVGWEHGGMYFVVCDQLLDVSEFCDVSEVSGGDVIVVELEVVGVEEGTGVNHALEVFVFLSRTLVLDCELSDQNSVGVHMI